MTPRLWLALALGPPLAVLVYFLTLLTSLKALNLGPALPVSSTEPLLYFFLLFGLPLAYGAEAVLFLLGYRFVMLRRPAPFIAVAAAAGAVVGTYGWPFLLGSPLLNTPLSITSVAMVAGTVSGTVSGAAFWFCGVRPSGGDTGAA